MQPQPQTVVVAPRPYIVTQYTVNASTIQITAILQLVAGFTVLLMQILFISVYGLLVAWASGWWSWIFYVAAGGCGIGAKGGSVTMVKAYIGMSIASTLCAGGTFIMWILGLMALSLIGWALPIIFCVITMIAIVTEGFAAIFASVLCYKAMNTGVLASQTVQQGAYGQPQYGQPMVYPPQTQTVAYSQNVQQTAYPSAAQQPAYPSAAQQPAYPSAVAAHAASDQFAEQQCAKLGAYPSTAQQTPYPQPTKEAAIN